MTGSSRRNSSRSSPEKEKQSSSTPRAQPSDRAARALSSQEPGSSQDGTTSSTVRLLHAQRLPGHHEDEAVAGGGDLSVGLSEKHAVTARELVGRHEPH